MLLMTIIMLTRVDPLQSTFSWRLSNSNLDHSIFFKYMNSNIIKRNGELRCDRRESPLHAYYLSLSKIQLAQRNFLTIYQPPLQFKGCVYRQTLNFMYNTKVRVCWTAYSAILSHQKLILLCTHIP
jgi:hypothetical protein